MHRAVRVAGREAVRIADLPAIAANATTQATRATTNRATAATPSRPRIHAAASAPHVNAKSPTTTTCTTQVDIASDCRLAKRVVRKSRVNTASAVHQLCHAQIDDDTRERQRLAPLDAVLAAHDSSIPSMASAAASSRSRRTRRSATRPASTRSGRSAGDRREPKCELRTFHGRLDRELRDLTVALSRVPVARRQERPVDRDREKERRSATSSLQSMLPPQERGGAVEWMPGSSGGMPMTPRNGRSKTRRPFWSTPRAASASSVQCNATFSPSCTPRRSLSGVCQPPASVTPHEPIRISSIRTSSV